MTTLPFDTLGYFERLKAAGVPESQAKVLADTVREQTEAQVKAIQEVVVKYDEATKKELATKADLRETELRLQSEIKAIELRLQSEIKETELRLLKWQIGGFVGLAVIMAKGFGWLGF